MGETRFEQQSRRYRDCRPGIFTVEEAWELCKLQQIEIERLRGHVTELRGAIDEVGKGLFGDDRWREAKATWWQRAKRAMEATEAEAAR